MIRRFLLSLAYLALSASGLVAEVARSEGATNILFVTMDDMNWDSIGVYGCPIPEISPNIDRLAREGMRFEYAFNQTSSCVPSRTTYQTGRYPHVNGVLSFYNVDFNLETLPEILRRMGYTTGVVNKPRDTSISEEYSKYWDYHRIMNGPDKRGAITYEDSLNAFFDLVESKGNPFYCVVNIADPHKPFFNDEASKKRGFDLYAPSIEYSLDDVEVPPFLVEHPSIREEMRNYYNSVKRGDDCVGVVLETLAARGHEEDTLVIFVSDHGMPLPFAKSSLYTNGTRTPWIARWPGKVERGRLESDLMVSAIDFMPTILDVVGAGVFDHLPGNSLLPALLGQSQRGPEFVFTEFNDIAGGHPFPMRAVYTKTHAYIFNAWANGERRFQSASTTHTSEKTLRELAKKGGTAAERYEFLVNRCLEEFYDYRADPHASRNLIDHRDHAEEIERLRSALASWMRETDDYALEAFEKRGSREQLIDWMDKIDAEALARAETLQWKRHSNRAGETGENTLLYRLH
ncbi:MAG: sulfatase [Verrucomicrobiota bacterium]